MVLPLALLPVSSAPIIVLSSVFLRSAVFILSISVLAIFPVSSVVSFPHIFYELAKLPILNTYLDLPLQIITIISAMSVTLVIITIMVFASLVSWGLHHKGLFEDSFTLREGVYPPC